MFENLYEFPCESLSLRNLAYIGDSIYELYSRLYVLNKCKGSMSGIHRQNIEIVNAGAQADALKNVMEFLTEEEKDIVRRGRNVNSGSVPKHGSVTDYRSATGLEALLGYLYIHNMSGRLEEILRRIFDEMPVKVEGK